MSSFREYINSYKEMVIGSRRGIEDVIVSMIPQLVLIMSGLITSILIARGLGPAGVGAYALIISVPTLVMSLSDSGIGQTAIRYASKLANHEDSTEMHAILRWAFNLRMVIVLIISLIFYMLSPYISADIWHDPALTELIRISLLIAIFGVISHIPSIYFQSLKRFKTNTIISTIQTLVFLAGILIIAWFKLWTLEWVLAISILSNFINALLFSISVPRDIFFEGFHVNGKSLINRMKNFWKAPEVDINQDLEETSIHSFTFYMFISTIVVMIITQFDIWLIGYFLNPTQVGIYNVAKNFTIPLTVILAAINTALWPRASALHSRNDTIHLLKVTFKFSIVVAAAGLIYSIFVPYLTPLVFGSAYASGISLGQVLCIRYCLAILICPLGVIGYSFGMVRIYWIINIIQLIVVLIINVTFLPQIGPMASALALIAIEIINLVIVGTIIWRKSKYMAENTS